MILVLGNKICEERVVLSNEVLGLVLSLLTQSPCPISIIIVLSVFTINHMYIRYTNVIQNVTNRLTNCSNALKVYLALLSF